ncbi:unnamed protein product [Microthlaspi erraticum]|uniref:F-box domain-containing protein n=1 Tax=Microthlaspi erraticum TaxID=1685480 RepID=A0A6D2ISM0_9BRAS|nr:unnamed protein product [Microthlaspi erraticum]
MMFTDLPRELEWEILSRVPPTSLNQFRSTCRRWYALLKDPRFIKKNSDKAARQMILTTYRSVYSVSIRNQNSFDPSIEFTGTLNSLKDSEQVLISHIFQCDGLFLCKTNDHGLVVWNPCTGQTRWIQFSNREVESLYALGYENNNKPSCPSYKILRCSRDLKRRVTEWEIYEFKSGSWRFLDEVAQTWRISSEGVSLKGNTYWLAWDRKNTPSSKFLLMFDFKRERFEHLSLPFQCIYNANLFLSVVREEKLSLLLERFNTEPFELKIWVIDTKIDEAKDTTYIQYFLVVDFSEIKRTFMTFVDSFLVDEENKKALCCGRDKEDMEKIIVYIVGGDQKLHVCKHIRGEIVQGPTDFLPHVLFSYAPSLVQIQPVEANEKAD